MLHVGLFIRPDHKDVIKDGGVTYDTADLCTPPRLRGPPQIENGAKSLFSAALIDSLSRCSVWNLLLNKS